MTTMTTTERRTLPGDPAVELHHEDDNILVAGFAESTGSYQLVVTGELHRPFPLWLKRWLASGCRSSGRMAFDDAVTYVLYDGCPGPRRAHLCRTVSG